MARFAKKSEIVEAITFDELVEYGCKHCGPHFHDGMPWSFDYKGHPITHENDNCYLVPTQEGTGRFERGDWLVSNEKGYLYVFRPDVFESTYGAVS
jgi:hypothetical protein